MFNREEELDAEGYVGTSRELAFGNNLSFIPFRINGSEMTGGYILKDGKLLGTCDVYPINSCETAGFFMIHADRKNKTYRYCDENGNIYNRVYGKRSGPFLHGFARIEIIDEPMDKSQLHPYGNYSLYTFARRGRNGQLEIMKKRFSHVTFMDKCGLARVILPGEKKYTYVTKDGKVLPYRFSNAEDCFRDGKAEVTLLDGTKAFICDNYDIVKTSLAGGYRLVTTLKKYNEKIKEGIDTTISQPPAPIPAEESQPANIFESALDYYDI